MSEFAGSLEVGPFLRSSLLGRCLSSLVLHSSSQVYLEAHAFLSRAELC